MAAIYTQNGETITEGLQGCNACDEAFALAKKWADKRGEPVILHDDDGEWVVHPRDEGGFRKGADRI